MLVAIVVIVLVATISALVLSLGGKVVKTTTFQYRQEQAALLAKSYTELAIMAVINYNRNSSGNCIENVNGVINNLLPGGSVPSGVSSTNGGGYDVQTRIYYLGNGLPCSSSRILNSSAIATNYADGNASVGGAVAAILVDVFVRYKDPDAANPTIAPWITYHHRTIQKI
jgi:hypothetical protein